MGDQTPKSEMVETPMPDFSDLIAKLSEAKAGSRELDAAIGAAIRIFPSDNPPSWVTNWAGPFVAHPTLAGSVALGHSDGAIGMHWRAAPVTTSVDAALALIEKRLPDRFPILIKNRYRHTETPKGREWSAELGGDEHVEVVASTPALAFCLALLVALREQQIDAALKPEGGET